MNKAKLIFYAQQARKDFITTVVARDNSPFAPVVLPN
jgi:hypothetical protein